MLQDNPSEYHGSPWAPAQPTDRKVQSQPGLLSYISEKGFDAEFGARPVKRVIQRDVLNPLSKEILSAKISTDSIILLDAFDGQLVFRNQ